jgi:hypothetical protein
MHPIQKIIENQKEFKDKIFSFLSKENAEAKKILNSINSEDEYIIKEKNKLKNRFKKIKQKKYIEHLFFLNSHRNTVFYVWWDDEEKEVKIFKYDKR